MTLSSRRRWHAGGASEGTAFWGTRSLGLVVRRRERQIKRQMAKGKRQKCVGFALRGPLFH